MQSAAAWLPDNGTCCVASIQQTIDASKFPTLVGEIHATAFVHHMALTDRDF